MEDIGDYLYLIIVAVAAIGSFLKNKSKKNETSSIPEIEEEEYEYEEIPEEVYKPTPIPAQRPEIVFERSFTEMKKTPHDTIMSFENTSDVSKLKAKKEVTRTITSKAKSIQEISIEPASDYSLNTVEKARAAFISSEIFNRKY